MGNPTKTTSIRTRQPECVVEYDTNAGRKSKHFTDGYAARRFFVAKDRAGKNPVVKSGELPKSEKPKRTRGPNRKPVKSNRPRKPYDEFPLYAHPTGYWAKKINGKIRMFGRWGHMRDGKIVYDSPDGWKEALELYEKTVHHIQAGRDDGAAVVTDEDAQQSERVENLTIRDLCNDFLTSQLRKLEAKELSPRTFNDCRNITDELVAAFGKDRAVATLRPNDFAACRSRLAKCDIGAVRLGNLIGGIRGVFVWAIKNNKIDMSINALCGTEFNKPSKKVLKKERNGRAQRVFTAEEIKPLIGAAKSPQVKAMILLGINCGFGNTDCSELPQSAINFETAEINFPRPKTACDRRVVLWPETIDALRKALEVRPRIPGDQVFVTKYGNPWVRVRESQDNAGAPKYVPIDGVGQEFGKLLKQLGINGRQGQGFYSLRHTFATVGRRANDDEALKLCMGHGDNSMLNAHYTHDFPRARLDAVAEHVRQWLYG